MSGAAKTVETAAKAAEDAVESIVDIAALQKDFAALKKDVASLLDHLQEETVNGADRVYRTVAKESQRQAEVLSHRIESQPLIAVLIAAGIGYIGGRLLSR